VPHKREKTWWCRWESKKTPSDCSFSFSSPNSNSPPQNANPPPQPVLQHQRQPQFTHSTSSDPFHLGPQLYAPHDAYPPRSFDSSSHPSSASVSLDNLSAGLSYALPATALIIPPGHRMPICLVTDKPPPPHPFRTLCSQYAIRSRRI
jgi:hypothetical protein